MHSFAVNQNEWVMYPKDTSLREEDVGGEELSPMDIREDIQIHFSWIPSLLNLYIPNDFVEQVYNMYWKFINTKWPPCRISIVLIITIGHYYSTIPLIESSTLATTVMAQQR